MSNNQLDIRNQQKKPQGDKSNVFVSSFKEYGNNYNHYRIIENINDTKDAIKHQKASMIGTQKINKFTDTDEYCPCCHNFCYEKQFKLSDPVSNYSKVAPILTIILYFNLFCLFLLIFNFLFYGLLGSLILSQNQVPFQCFLNDCSCIQNSDPSEDCEFHTDIQKSYHTIFITINIILCIIAKYLFFFWLKRKSFIYDDKLQTPSDYTVIVSNIKRSFNSDQVLDRLNNYFKKYNADIKKINIVYDIRDQYGDLKQYAQISRKINILQGKKEKLEKQEKNSEAKQYEKKINTQKDKLRVIKDRILQLRGKQNKNIKFTGKAFVTFNTQQQMVNVVRQHRWKFMKIKFSDGEYNIIQASDPQDIIWHNFGPTRVKKIKIRFITWIVSLSIIALALLIVFFLKRTQITVIENSGENLIGSYIISLIISMVIGMISFGLKLLLSLLIKKEYRSTYSSENQNFIFKVTITDFVLYGLLILIANLSLRNYYYDILWNQTGVATNAIILLLVTFLADMFLYIFNFQYFLKLFKRWRLKNKLKFIEDFRNEPVLQCELNEAYEGMVFDETLYFENLFKIMCACLFYQTLTPYVLLIGIVYLICQHFIMKYDIIKRCNRPRFQNFYFITKIFAAIEFSIFLLATGYFTFYRIATGHFSPASVILFVITFIDWIILDMRVIGNLFLKKSNEQSNYSEVFLNFPNDYDRQNPVTQRKAFQEWFDQKQQGTDKNIKDKGKNNQKFVSSIKQEDKVDVNYIDTMMNYINNQQQFTNNDRIYLQDFNIHQDFQDLGYHRDLYADVDLYSLNNVALNNQQVDYSTPKDNFYGQQQLFQNYYPIQQVPLHNQAHYQDQRLINDTQNVFGVFTSNFKQPQQQQQNQNNVNYPDYRTNDLQNQTSQDNIQQQYQLPQEPLNQQNLINPLQQHMNQNQYNIDNQTQPLVQQQNNNYQINNQRPSYEDKNLYQLNLEQNNQQPNNFQMPPQNNYQINPNVQQNQPNQYGLNLNQNIQDQGQSNQYQIDYNQRQSIPDQPLQQNNYQLNFNNDKNDQNNGNDYPPNI